MSKRKKSPAQDAQLEGAIQLPLRLVFNVSTLAAALSVLFAIATGDDELYRIMLRAMLIFIAFAVAGSIIMAVTIAIIHRIKQEELNERLRLAEEEQIAASLNIHGASQTANVSDQNNADLQSG